MGAHPQAVVRLHQATGFRADLDLIPDAAHLLRRTMPTAIPQLALTLTRTTLATMTTPDLVPVRCAPRVAITSLGATVLIMALRMATS
jgi:hypothetical protein